uniref:Sister chromatid cohesion protein DCC1 n=1 Tax=Ascaris lumbricoides TaxID=6252 RepID=A0A0M3IPU3_ASCLU
MLRGCANRYAFLLMAFQGEVQQIEFSSPLLSGDYRLIEVNPKLADRIESGERLVFRGELDDNPVLCTQQETYQVKEAETSNTLLVLPAVHFANEVGNGDHFLTARKVVAMHSQYVELRKLDVISLNRLKELLRENEIDWDETENPKQEGKSYTLDDLLDVVQMSEEQLMNALHYLPVIHQHGYLRMLSSSYRDRLLMELTDCCDDEDEPLIEVNSICIEAFSEAVARRNPTRNVPSEAIRWLIDTHCNRIIDDDHKERFALDERAVCRSKASQLLRAAVRFEYSAFEKLLREMLPEGIEMKDEYLNGLALVDDSLTKGKTIRYMNIEDMPDDEYKRLQLLFSIRSKWKVADIQHFLTDLCPTSRAISEMLAKYCRHSTGDGERYVVGLK